MGKNQLSIGLYIDSLSMGGAERVTIYLTNYFSKNNINTTIITNKINKKEYSLNDETQRISLLNNNEKINQLSIISRLRSCIKKEKIDLLIVMGSPLISYAVPAVIGREVKLIVSERNSPKDFSGKKYVQYLSNKMYNFSDGYVFQTEEASSYYDWIDGPQKIIPNPLFKNNIPSPHTNTRKKNIVNVGRLHPQKNQKMLINAFSFIANDYPDYNLTIYGEGSERGNLEEQILNLNLEDRVFLPGSTPNVLEKIKDASIFAFSSDFEGMPNALIEAMALGLPVLSTESSGGGPKELITHNVNGLLTPIDDTAKFSENLDYLLTNPEFANSLGFEAQKIKEKLDAEKIGKQWLDFSIKVLNTK